MGVSEELELIERLGEELELALLEGLVVLVEEELGETLEDVLGVIEGL